MSLSYEDVIVSWIVPTLAIGNNIYSTSAVVGPDAMSTGYVVG
jgi:hypothetical protein